MSEMVSGALILDHDGVVELVFWEKADGSDERRLLLETWMAQRLGCDMIAMAAILDPELDPSKRYRT